MTTKMIRNHISRASFCQFGSLKGRNIRPSNNQFFTTGYDRSTFGNDVVPLMSLHKWTSTSRQFSTKASTTNNNKNDHNSANEQNSAISRRTEFKNIPIDLVTVYSTY